MKAGVFLVKSSFTGYRIVAITFWVLTVVAIAIWSQVPDYVVGWDARVSRSAVESLQAGHDPYSDGIAIQRQFHSQLVHIPTEPTPFMYVYSPITIPMLRTLTALPMPQIEVVYWVLYVLGALAAIWVGSRFVEEQERQVFSLITPVVIFFPGLLQNDVLFSGNVAFLLYGAVLTAALVGWRTGNWKWFYAATLAASCCKAPLLSLLAIPVFSARRQWVPAGVTGAVGVGLFAMQPFVWPTLFAHYMESLDLMFRFNHDFSGSPAGLLADALFNVIPYGVTTTGFYLIYASVLLGVLFYLSRRYMAGRFTLTQWAPVLLVGVLLLNPRIMEYDVAAVTLPMALILWRWLTRERTTGQAVFLGAVILGVMNAAAAQLWWKPAECFFLMGVFGVGAYDLVRVPVTMPTLEYDEDEMDVLVVQASS